MKNEEYAVTVDYDLFVYDAIQQGDYCSYGGEDILYDDCLPGGIRFEQSYSAEGTAQLDIILVQFDRETKGLRTACSELDKIGLRPATLKELIAFGNKYSAVCDKRCVYALGSVWRFPFRFLNNDYVPELSKDNGRLSLSLEAFRGTYRSYYYAAVRKGR